MCNVQQQVKAATAETLPLPQFPIRKARHTSLVCCQSATTAVTPATALPLHHQPWRKCRCAVMCLTGLSRGPHHSTTNSQHSAHSCSYRVHPGPLELLSDERQRGQHNRLAPCWPAGSCLHSGHQAAGSATHAVTDQEAQRAAAVSRPLEPDFASTQQTHCDYW